jgi:exportin-2 (importin alpha re-exporter)
MSPQTLQQIVEVIVVRNLTATEADEELFEMNPQDYIRKDIEGSDTNTRRRSAMELVR